MKKILVFSVYITCIATCYTQDTSVIKRIDPTNWWVGMKNQNFQLLVYGKDAGTFSYTINYPGIKLIKTNKVENPNYVFLDLVISPATKAGSFNVVGRSGDKTISKSYELKSRTKELKGTGISTADFIYLIMPDRFANGDATNDRFMNMLDTNVDANNPILRHGGDLKGITDHLDYLQELGVTAIWPTPLIVNDETLKQEAPDRMQAGYHGYHFTDHYQIDPRFGGNEGYVQFSKALHQKGFKLIQDAVYNHVSDDHCMYKDQPAKDWFNTWQAFTASSHKEQALGDPHAADSDKKLLLDGWFTSFLPDLNQRNPFLANYLIQHAIWSTETFNIDAWRIDTYKYNDQAFMNRCNQALLTEYPHIMLFGESTAANPYALSYFVKSNMAYPFKSNLPGTLDFPLNNAIIDALNQNFGWDQGVSRLYQTLAQDGVYKDPTKMVTQIDNHDMDRFLSVIDDDFDKYKIGITWLLTTRGIPSWYYGTEILMKNTRNPSDAEVRRNFPGGFAGDKDNKFTAQGRSDRENEAFNYVKTLANYRKNTPALSSGSLMQYVPQDGVYVYFRYKADKTIMIATNTNDKDTEIKTGRFVERVKGFTKARNVITNDMINDISSLKLGAKSIVVLELMK